MCAYLFVYYVWLCLRGGETGLLVRVVFEKTGCEMGEPEGSAAGIYLPLPVALLYLDMVNKIGDQKGAPFGCSTG